MSVTTAMIIKRILVGVVVIAAVAGTMMVLQQNKAHSEAKVKGIVQHPFTVRVAKISMHPISDTMSLIGTVAPARETSIASETQGRVISISTEIGSFKKSGQVVARVDDEIRRAAVMTAEANLEKARKDLERYTMLQTEKALPDQQIDNARLAVRLAEAQLIVVRHQLRDTRITSPISGVIVARAAEVGTMVQPGMVLATIADISSLKVKINVPEDDLLNIRVGDEVGVTSDVHPGQVFSGRVATISSRGDEAHTYPVEVIIPNRSDYPLRPGMFTRVIFPARKGRSATMVPRTAIIGSIRAPQVYVVENGQVKLRTIGVAGESGTMVEVTSGLRVGEEVVTAGTGNLRDGMKVTVAR